MKLSHRIYRTSMLIWVLVASLALTSTGGVYAASVDAAQDLSSNAATTVAPDNSAILGGVALLGLVALLSHHDSSTSGTQDGGAKNAPTTPTTTTPATQPVGTSSAALEQQMLSLVNQDRAKQGLPALTWNGSLAAVGRAHSQDMITRNYFAHNTPEGVTPFQRMDQAGIRYSYAGENIALNSSVSAAEQAFMNSAGHRANILSTHFTQIGIGIVQNGSQIMVSQEFIG